MDLIDTFKKNIKDKIAEQHITMRAVEKKAGLKNASLQSFLSGRVRSPSLEKSIAISKALDTSITELLKSDSTIYERNWNPDLYHNILSKIGSVLDQKKLSLSKIQIDKIIDDVYLFSIKSSPPLVDETFVHFIIEKQTL